MLKLLNSFMLNKFITQGLNIYFKLMQPFQSGSNLFSSWSSYYKVGQALLQSRVVLRYYKVVQVVCYKHGWLLLQSGVCTAKWGNFITMWGSYRKIEQYLNQNYIKQYVRRIYFPPPFFSFDYLPQGRMETHVQKQGHNDLRVELYMLKLLSEGIDSFRKMCGFVKAQTTFAVFAFIRLETIQIDHNMM